MVLFADRFPRRVLEPRRIEWRWLQRQAWPARFLWCTQYSYTPFQTHTCAGDLRGRAHLLRYVPVHVHELHLPPPQLCGGAGRAGAPRPAHESAQSSKMHVMDSTLQYTFSSLSLSFLLSFFSFLLFLLKQPLYINFIIHCYSIIVYIKV